MIWLVALTGALLIAHVSLGLWVLHNDYKQFRERYPKKPKLRLIVNDRAS